MGGHCGHPSPWCPETTELMGLSNHRPQHSSTAGGSRKQGVVSGSPWVEGAADRSCPRLPGGGQKHREVGSGPPFAGPVNSEHILLIHAWTVGWRNTGQPFHSPFPHHGHSPSTSPGGAVQLLRTRRPGTHQMAPCPCPRAHCSELGVTARASSQGTNSEPAPASRWE